MINVEFTILAVPIFVDLEMPLQLMHRARCKVFPDMQRKALADILFQSAVIRLSKNQAPYVIPQRFLCDLSLRAFVIHVRANSNGHAPCLSGHPQSQMFS